jgi:PEP-CTERM motif-containing protein
MRTAGLLMVLLGVAALSHAGTIFTWDNDAEGWSGFDGFSDSVGVTDGTHSGYKTELPGGWSATFQSGYSGSYVADLAANNLLSVDMTMSGDYVQDWHQLQIWFLIQGDGFNTGDVGYIMVPDGGVTTTITYDYSAMTVNPASGWAQIRIGTNFAGGAAPADVGTLYLDNLRLTPEPATLALLGLGSLLAIRRRR